LAVIRERASGELRNREEAIKWYRFAAERGMAASQANLGYLLSQDVSPKARKWIEKAAAQGNPRGRYLLGMLRLEAGQDEEAAGLLGQAAEADEREAQYRLALLYGTGRGVPKDEAAAMRWLRRAAE